jgi:hypothetical protein
MRQTKEIKLFGQRYRLSQISAAEGFRYMNVKRDATDELMALIDETAIYVGGQWQRLTKENIDNYVKDAIDVMQPRLVLKALVKELNDYNFGFLNTRKTFRVPSYLRPDHDYEVRQIEGESPVMGVLISEGKATLRELQEYYSLEDAFKIYDILFVEKLNSAEAHHEAVKKTKSKSGKSTHAY